MRCGSKMTSHKLFPSNRKFNLLYKEPQLEGFVTFIKFYSVVKLRPWSSEKQQNRNESAILQLYFSLSSKDFMYLSTAIT